MTGKHLFGALVLGLASGGLACDQKPEPPSPTATISSAPAQAQPTPAVAPTGDVTASAAQILSAYEKIRARLASDQTEGIEQIASDVAGAARVAASQAAAPQKVQLESIARAADGLKAKAGASVAEVRKMFGELSRAIVGLLSASPELRKGYHIFHCPMAEGYQKWVQAKETIENPYMGKKMLECGSTTEWSA